MYLLLRGVPPMHSWQPFVARDRIQGIHNIERLGRSPLGPSAVAFPPLTDGMASPVAGCPAPSESHTVRCCRRKLPAFRRRAPKPARRWAVTPPSPPLGCAATLAKTSHVLMQAELTFDGVNYILSVRCAGGDSLEVVAERKEDASTWAATFAAKCEQAAARQPRRSVCRATQCPVAFIAIGCKTCVLPLVFLRVCPCRC